MNVKQLINENKCTILDVRTKEEFEGGNVSGSINIPLGNIMSQLDEIKKMKTPLVICCASGARSGSAVAFLSQHQIECMNAGSWMDINFNQNKTA